MLGTSKEVRPKLRRRLRGITVVLLLLAFQAEISRAFGEHTLRKVLSEHSIDISGADLPNLDKEVWNGAEVDDGGHFIAAYYLCESFKDGCQLVGHTIYVDRLDKASGAWSHGAIEANEIPVSDKKLYENGTKVLGAGSITDIEYSKHFVYLHTHRSPSAGLTVVLDESLQFRSALYGWILKISPEERVVYHRSMVHFAPTHPAEVGVYDPGTGFHQLIYPMKPHQQVRRAHIKKVGDAYRKLGADWLRANNHHGDPEKFTNYVAPGDVAINDKTGAVSFIARFDNYETLDELGRLKLGYFREFRDVVGEAGIKDPPSWALHEAFLQGVTRARNGNLLEKVPDLFAERGDLRGMVHVLVGATNAKKLDGREFLISLDPRWAGAETWRKVAEAVASPPETTDVVYAYRNVVPGRKITYTEMLLNDSRRKHTGRTDEEILSAIVGHVADLK